MMSDISHYDRVNLILIKVVLSKCRKLEISLKRIKDLFQNNHCTELTSNERMSFDRSGAHLTSLAEFGFSPFQDGGIEIHFTQTQSLLTKSITTKQRIFSSTTTDK